MFWFSIKVPVYVCFPNNIINGISFCSQKYLHVINVACGSPSYDHIKKERKENCWWGLVRSNGLEWLSDSWCQALGLFTGPSSDLVSDTSPLQCSMYPLFISYLPTLTTAFLPTLFFLYLPLQRCILTSWLNWLYQPQTCQVLEQTSQHPTSQGSPGEHGKWDPWDLLPCFLQMVVQIDSDWKLLLFPRQPP